MVGGWRDLGGPVVATETDCSQGIPAGSLNGAQEKGSDGSTHNRKIPGWVGLEGIFRDRQVQSIPYKSGG